MKHRFMRKFFFCIVLLVPLSVQSQHQMRQFVANVAEEIDTRVWSSVVDMTSERLVAKPYDRQMYYVRAMAFYYLDEYEKAMRDFDNVITLHPYSPRAYYFRGECRFKMGEVERGIKDNTVAFHMSEDLFIRYQCLMNTSAAKQEIGDMEGAYQDFYKLYVFDSTNVRVLNGLAMTAYRTGRKGETLGYLYRAEAIAPYDLYTLGNLGFFLSQMGEYEESLFYLNTVLEVRPYLPLPKNNRGFVRYKLGDYLGALDDINSSLEMHPNNSFAYKNRALVYIALNDFESACADLETALELGFDRRYGDEVKELIEKYCLQPN